MRDEYAGRRGFWPTAAQTRAIRFADKQDWLRSLSKKAKR